ncbi:MAG: hypothetical protein H6Q32_756 [Bacteroidetes bacterium]|nr:hypothetical protein [Bacteroidota bacterium]
MGHIQSIGQESSNGSDGGPSFSFRHKKALPGLVAKERSSDSISIRKPHEKTPQIMTCRFSQLDKSAVARPAGVPPELVASDSSKSVVVFVKMLPHIFLVSLYCLVTVGMTVSTHFCAGIPVDTVFGHATAAEPDWCCGDLEANDGCCHTTVTTLVVSDDHTVSASTSLTHIMDVLCAAPVAASTEFLSTPPSSSAPDSSPPGVSPPLPLLHHVLLI